MTKPKETVKTTTDHIEQWKVCADLVKNYNNKRNASNIAFIGLAITTFYIMYRDKIEITWLYVLAILICSFGWAMTIYSYRKATDFLYDAMKRIEESWEIKVFMNRPPKILSELSYEYIFPILLSCITIFLYFQQ